MSEPFAWVDKNSTVIVYASAKKAAPTTYSAFNKPLYLHPDPRIAELEATCVDHGEIQKALCESIAELEAVLRECREALDLAMWREKHGLSEAPELYEEATAKIDEVLNEDR